MAPHGDRILRPMRFIGRLPAFLVATLSALGFLAPAAAQTTAPIDPASLGSLRWRSIGPANTGGRVDDVAVARVPGVPDAIYVATASGGVFKSTNQGTSWTPMFDRVNAVMSIGDIAGAPSAPNVLWVGTGGADNTPGLSRGGGGFPPPGG